jgi:hypothetical protein
MSGANPGVRTFRVFAGVGGTAALIILTNPSTADAAVITDEDRVRWALGDDAVDKDGDGIPAGLDPDDRTYSGCSPEALEGFFSILDRMLQEAAWQPGGQEWIEDDWFGLTGH